MPVIDWSQIGEGYRLDVRWTYLQEEQPNSRKLNSDQLLLLLCPFLFSAWMI